MSMLAAVRDHAGGVLIELYVQPRASKTRLVGVHDGAIKLAVAAPPVDGEANAAVCAWMAQTLGVARRAVAVHKGESSRRKTVFAAGVSAEQALAILAPGP